jgi:hypothetical protein
MTYKVKVALIVAVAVCVVSGETANSATRLGSSALRGLGELVVHVIVDSELEEANAGLQSELQAQIELRLRTVGLRVLTLEEATRRAEEGVARPLPALGLRVDAMVPPQMELFVFNVRLEFMERVRLERDKSLLLIGVTWQTGYFGSYDMTEPRERLRLRAIDCLDEFCNDYLAANPKKQRVGLSASLATVTLACT